MDEVEKRSRMSQESPPMTMPLVEHLQYHGMTDFSNEVLMGRPPQVEGIDEATQCYLDQLRAVDGHLPEPAKPFSFNQYLEEVQRLRERTSSGPSAVSPAMVKTEAKDDELGRIGWLASNFLWCSGYSSNRSREGLDLLIHKKPNDYRVH